MTEPAQNDALPPGEVLSRPIVVVDWDEMMEKKAQWVEQNAEKLRERDNDPTVTSIHGFFDDKDPIQYGVPAILEVTKTLESFSIPCCLVGICALIYYGARRIRHDWEICVSTEQLNTAASLLTSEPYNKTYEPFAPRHRSNMWPQSILHTFPRFKVRGVRDFFTLIPSRDAHISCEPANIERSHTGLPYPKLEVIAQAFLDTYDELALSDLVDAMDLSTQWGHEHLDLTGTTDTDWAEWKNSALEASGNLTSVNSKPGQLRELWNYTARTKQSRAGAFKYPPHLFASRFRMHGDVDPRLLSRLSC